MFLIILLTTLLSVCREYAMVRREQTPAELDLKEKEEDRPE